MSCSATPCARSAERSHRSSPETAANGRSVNPVLIKIVNDPLIPVRGGILMSLKVELKPGERIIIGDCVVTNTDQRTRLLIEGDTPVLRQKDILTSDRA